MKYDARKQLKAISSSFLLKIFYLFIFREKRREGEKEGEKHWAVASSTRPEWELNQPPFTLRKDTPTNWATPVRAILPTFSIDIFRLKQSLYAAIVFENLKRMLSLCLHGFNLWTQINFSSNGIGLGKNVVCQLWNKSSGIVIRLHVFSVEASCWLESKTFF